MKTLGGLVVCLGVFGFGSLSRADKAPFLSAQRGSSSAASWGILKQGLLSSDYAVRLITTQILGELPGAEDWLAHSLSDPEHDVRVAAVESLRQLASKRAMELLRAVRDDPTEKFDVRVLAAGALLQQGAR